MWRTSRKSAGLFQRHTVCIVISNVKTARTPAGGNSRGSLDEEGGIGYKNSVAQSPLDIVTSLLRFLFEF